MGGLTVLRSAHRAAFLYIIVIHANIRGEANMRCFIYSLLVLVSWRAIALADVKPHGLFSDHMVLQQGANVPVWGHADPGETVTVSIGGQWARTQADGSGKWMVYLGNLPPGGPYELKLQGKNNITLKDVLVGEVWVCSGQSNMEWSLAACKEPRENKDFMASTANDHIRLFQHKKVTSGSPQSEIATDNNWKEWKVCGPTSAGGFSGVAYYFGRKLQTDLKVPVGLIHTSWGGTPAEAWTTREFLGNTPELTHYIADYTKNLEAFRNNSDQMKKDYEQRVKHWEEAAAKARAENKQVPPRPRMPSDPDKSPNSPSVLYNAMIHPLLPFAIKGAIWYQGESNAGRAYEYRTLFPAMIQSWRAAWGYDFPFYFVQLAPWRAIKDQPSESDWAELREAQLLTTQRLPRTGMAVITDTTNQATDQRDIHPQNKGPVGERLALAALQTTYGLPIVGASPVYDGRVQFEGDRAIVHFVQPGVSNQAGTSRSRGGILGLPGRIFRGSGRYDNVLFSAELAGKGDKLTGFAIAAEDKKFVWADATIVGNTVVVSSPEVHHPVAVRFGWADYPVVNLFNKEGLPASPFRTDDWPGVTVPKAK
jgi:sialate O-acetylesterase